MRPFKLKAPCFRCRCVCEIGENIEENKDKNEQ